VIYCKKRIQEEFKEALIKTKQIPWHKFIAFQGVNEQHWSLLQDVLNTQQLKCLDLEPCYTHHLNASEALQYNLPEYVLVCAIKKFSIYFKFLLKIVDANCSLTSTYPINKHSFDDILFNIFMMVNCMC
jgi:hypothetical protein